MYRCGIYDCFFLSVPDSIRFEFNYEFSPFKKLKPGFYLRGSGCFNVKELSPLTMGSKSKIALA